MCQQNVIGREIVTRVSKPRQVEGQLHVSANRNSKRNKLQVSADRHRKRKSYVCQQTVIGRGIRYICQQNAIERGTVTFVSRPRRGIISMCQQTAIGRGTVQCQQTAIGRGISYKCQQTAIRESVTHVSKPRQYEEPFHVSADRDRKRNSYICRSEMVTPKR